MKKEKRYWLSGGIVAVGIVIFLGIIGSIFNFDYGNFLEYIFYPIYLISSFILSLNTSLICIGTAMVITLFGILAESFLIGSVIGIIYKKIK